MPHVMDRVSAEVYDPFEHAFVAKVKVEEGKGCYRRSIMQKIRTAVVSGWVLGLIVPVGYAQTFDLSFDSPNALFGDPGSDVEFGVFAQMTPGDGVEPDGAQGWSLSMSADGCAIIGISDAGTAAATVDEGGLRDSDPNSFHIAELTNLGESGSECEGRNGAVAATVLSLVSNTTLPTDSTSDVIRLDIQATVPSEDQCIVCTIEYVDGCQGSGQPIENIVTRLGETVIPTTASATVEICRTDMPPVAGCIESVNPSGKKIPPAGKTTLPGPKGGQNEDGFYELVAEDDFDANPQIFVTDTGSGTVFGPFRTGDKIKYTEDPDAVPTSKKMGSVNGEAGAVTTHIIGNGDAVVTAVDQSGNQSEPVSCLVPPVPK